MIMVDLQAEPDVTGPLIPSSDADHLPSTGGFDDNQNFSYERSATTEMEASNAPPRPAKFSRNIKIVVAAVLLLLVFIVVVVLALIWENNKLHALHADQPSNKQQLPNLENKMSSFRPEQSRNCVVPADPEHGKYIIEENPTAKPGDSFDSLKLIVVCQPGYRVTGEVERRGRETGVVLCVGGTWSKCCPECVRFCKLDNNPTVRYDCRVPGYSGHRKCNDYEPSGTVVEPKCSGLNYAFTTLASMTCINGSWDYVATCSTECGRVSQIGETLMTDGRSAQRGELPWHVGVYWKNITSYKQICSGSIVSNAVVISAAHCFWDDGGGDGKKLPASWFAVEAGKFYREWNDRRDVHAQKSFVKEINIPDHYQGELANYQADIAVLILESPFKYTPFVGPVCLSFDIKFETRQLQPEKKGKVAGWGVTAENGSPSPFLKVAELPYVDIKKCIEAAPSNFKALIASDKICAGYKNGTALCRGDSGGGIAFPQADRYYLRGIVSVAPNSDYTMTCYIYAFTAFTQILKHEHFILMYI